MPNKNLVNIAADTMLTRDPIKREFKLAVRGESAAGAIGHLTHGCEIYGFTKGQFSCIDVISHCPGLMDTPSAVALTANNRAVRQHRTTGSFILNPLNQTF